MTSWLTLLLAGVAVIIASMQWFVARQKFVLDLFDRRFKAYTDVLAAVRPIVAAANADHNQIVDLNIATQNAKFLFGSDVNEYLQEIYKTAVKLGFWNSIYNSHNPQAHLAPDGMYDCSTRLAEFFDRYPALCQAYMMMPEKRVRTPLEWYRDRNELRKSYGSEPPVIDV
ncbi:hypothetical protein EHI44_24230 [Rhizobium leguminosarum]|uniref:hypothetical protein n=1 Tax=Rhizobium leguminosarum TaxID=384 RepID=UPI000FF7D0F6|nr:hypothetical protein [Rhizobium leguminosarum]RWY82400.1 hypothetical protein EHI44_24230 [Rhizobium leguminosarum]